MHSFFESSQSFERRNVSDMKISECGLYLNVLSQTLCSASVTKDNNSSLQTLSRIHFH